MSIPSRAAAALRSRLTGVFGSSGNGDRQAGDKSQLLQSPSHDDYLLRCVLKTSVNGWTDGELQDGVVDTRLNKRITVTKYLFKT